MTEVFLYKIHDVSDGELSRLLNLVSPYRREKVLRLKVKDKQLQSLFAKLLLRAVLCDSLGVSNSELSFATTEKGKPYLENRPDCHFSISHTDGLVAVALSENSVGVDVESVKPIDPKLCERFFSQSEQDYVFMKETEVDQRFFEVWTKKEAFAKYTGLGLSEIFGQKETLYKTFTVENYAVAVCCDGDLTVIPNNETDSILGRFIG